MTTPIKPIQHKKIIKLNILNDDESFPLPTQTPAPDQPAASTDEIVMQLSQNFTAIIPRDELRKHKKLDWGDNGLGDRWANKKYNYTAIYSDKTKTYSENEDTVCSDVVNAFRQDIATLAATTNATTKGIIGIFVHSKRTNVVKRPIRKDIDRLIKQNACCSSCGSSSDIICDHKNDIYNDADVLNVATQQITDFQPLCNHCNLQKRQIFKDETALNKLYSAKQLQKYRAFPFEFPWEKKAFDITDIRTKQDTYWYDPVEFNRKIYTYMMFTLPVITEIKRKRTRRDEL